MQKRLINLLSQSHYFSILRYLAGTMRSLLKKTLDGRKIILASKSPRRQELLKMLELDFEIRTKETDESYSENLKGAEVARYLAEKKALAFQGELNADDLLITSDTTVCVDDQILNKPENKEEAMKMLKQLSGRKHEVITACALFSKEGLKVFHDSTEVHFRELSLEEIEHYVDGYAPFDKAGAYGIQDFIGAIGVDRIHGSYYTVMGLPLHLLYKELKNLLEKK